jgi:hypothetical protein
VDRNEKDTNKREEYPIGYKKPPRHSQFQPGQSGNRNGRPKQAPTFAEVVTKNLRKKAKVKMGNEVLTLSMLEAMALKQISLAVAGNHRSTAIVLDSLKASENDRSNNLLELTQQFRAIYDSHQAEKSANRPRSVSNKSLADADPGKDE